MVVEAILPELRSREGATLWDRFHDSLPVLKVRLRGTLAWFMRRTYCLLPMPGWGRRLRIVIDWTSALLLPPDMVKLDLASEQLVHRRVAAVLTFLRDAGLRPRSG